MEFLFLNQIVIIMLFWTDSQSYEYLFNFTYFQPYTAYQNITTMFVQIMIKQHQSTEYFLEISQAD